MVTTRGRGDACAAQQHGRVVPRDLGGACANHFHKHHGVLAGLLVTAIFLANHLVRSLLVLIAAPFRPRLFPRIARYAELSWKLVAESPMLSRNHHTFA